MSRDAQSSRAQPTAGRLQDVGGWEETDRFWDVRTLEAGWVDDAGQHIRGSLATTAFGSSRDPRVQNVGFMP